jgi:hypothetical protein
MRIALVIILDAPGRVKIGARRCHDAATGDEDGPFAARLWRKVGPIVSIEMNDRSRRARWMSVPGREPPTAIVNDLTVLDPVLPVAL